MNAFAPKPVIIIPDGKAVTIGQYVAAWRKLKTIPPEQEITGWSWYPKPASEILRDFSHGVDDRINRRGAMKTEWPEPKPIRILRVLEQRVTVSCRWCGQRMPYKPVHSRFCEPSCRHSFMS